MPAYSLKSLDRLREPVAAICASVSSDSRATGQSRPRPAPDEWPDGYGCGLRLLATSLLAVIGIFDLLNAARDSATDPSWLGFYNEAYLVVALIYFAICFSASRLERRLRAGR